MAGELVAAEVREFCEAGVCGVFVTWNGWTILYTCSCETSLSKAQHVSHMRQHAVPQVVLLVNGFCGTS